MIKIKTNKYPWFKYYKDMKSTLKYPDTSMYELVKRACIKYPSNIAYSYFGTKVTYKSLLRKIDLCAQSYAKIGVVKNSNVTICSPNTPEAIISFYALNKIGAVVNMLHPLSSEEEIKFALNLTKCEYLFIADIAYSKFKNDYGAKAFTEEEKEKYGSLYNKISDPTGVGVIYADQGRQVVTPSQTKAWTDFYWGANIFDIHPTDTKIGGGTLTPTNQKANETTDGRWNTDWRKFLFMYSDKSGWLEIDNLEGDTSVKDTDDIKNKLRGRFLYNDATQKYYYVGRDGVVYDAKVVSSHATGILSAPGGISMVNDDPQYGLEGIITPQGTLTALPSKSGVVPADMTRNVWQLGEVAPNLVKQLVDINGKFNSPLGFGTDESFNVDHLDVHMVAQPGFDMDDFVRQLRAARDLSKHS